MLRHRKTDAFVPPKTGVLHAVGSTGRNRFSVGRVGPDLALVLTTNLQHFPRSIRKTVTASISEKTFLELAVPPRSANCLVYRPLSPARVLAVRLLDNSAYDV